MDVFNPLKTGDFRGFWGDRPGNHPRKNAPTRPEVKDAFFLLQESAKLPRRPAM
jgi:hypothetical protein